MMVPILLCLFFVATQAKPELYRENEDFQFSRSSSSDGSKSGFYGAQRGNMGGNYEKAHNMDNLAQHQMSSLVGQLDGELGDISQNKMGSIQASANTRGIYGSGNYDLSNLQGRNFQEGARFEDSSSHSSMRSHNSAYNSHSSALLNSGYNNRYTQGSRVGGYQAAGYTSQLQNNDLQAVDNLNIGTGFEYGKEASQSSKYFLQSSHRDISDFDQKSTNLQSSNYEKLGNNHRFISARPVKVVLRPGAKVVVPVSFENGQELSASSHNLANSEVEVLTNTDNRASFIPTSNNKHYESAYSYKKEWEKHDTVPLAVVPDTKVILPKQSELYEDNMILGKKSSSQYHELDSQNLQVDHSHRNSNLKTASSSTLFNADHHAYQNSQINADSRAAIEMNHKSDTNSFVSGTSTGSELPKSYQSSYSYHKSWERQGDPYVIKPAQTIIQKEEIPEKLRVSSYNQGYSSDQHLSHQNYAQTVECDDSNLNRKRRSICNAYKRKQTYAV